jgi:hypothetical protein
MATATIQFATSIEPPTAAVWWRRKDPYVLTPVAAVHIAFSGPALHWVGNTWAANARYGPYLQALVMGMTIAQLFLLSLWAALGGLKTLPRLGIVSLVFLGGLSSHLIAARLNWVDTLDGLLACGLIGTLAVGSYTAMLLPLRRLLGWRIDFDERDYRGLPGRRGQVGLLDFAALSCAVAIPLTSVRLLDESSGSASGEGLELVGFLSIVALAAAPACYLALVWRRPLLTVAAAAVIVLLVSWAHSLASVWFKSLELFGGSVKFWALDLETLAFHAGVVITCLTTFAVLRWFGLKLFSVPYATRDAICHA